MPGSKPAFQLTAGTFKSTVVPWSGILSIRRSNPLSEARCSIFIKPLSLKGKLIILNSQKVYTPIFKESISKQKPICRFRLFYCIFRSLLWGGLFVILDNVSLFFEVYIYIFRWYLSNVHKKDAN